MDYQYLSPDPEIIIRCEGGNFYANWEDIETIGGKYYINTGDERSIEITEDEIYEI